MPMQTILGSTGTIGTELARSLLKYTDKIRLVSRDPKPVNPADEPITADLLESRQVINAIKGSEIVYLVAGLKYDYRVWEEQWPLIMQNVLDACRKHNAKLVFFDNVYAYGKVNGWMTEETPYNPCSKKGIIRAGIANMLLEDIKRSHIEGMIVRAADFYGPNLKNSFFNIMVLENLKKGKKAQWLVSDKFKHSFTFTPDAGKATALLGNTPTAFNQVWHLPADKNVLNGRELTELAAKVLGTATRYTVLPKFMIRLAGMNNGIIKETYEMLYQNDSDYLFDSSKFDKAFDFKTTTYYEGIKATAEAMK